MDMITVYDPKETDFSCNGIIPLLPTECTVTEELNGMFELKLTHPIDSTGRWKAIGEYYIIKAPTPRGDQLFRIYKTSKSLRNTITAHARHIFYDGSLNNFSAKATAITPEAAIKLMYANLEHPLPFTVSSDIDETVNVEYTDVNPVFALMDTEEGLVSKATGELLRDNYSIRLLKAIGSDRGVQIRYRKNLTGLEFTIDASDVVTMVKPKALSSDDKELLLPEVYIKSDLLDAYPMPLIKAVEYSDIRIGDDYSVQTAREEMRKRVTQMFAEGADKPDINAKVEFVHLGDTEEYKEYKLLEHVGLGDIITIIHEGLGVHVKAKCVKYAYDCLLRRYNKLEIGDLIDDIARVIGGVEAAFGSISKTAFSVNTQAAQLEARVAKLEGLAESSY